MHSPWSLEHTAHPPTPVAQETPQSHVVLLTTQSVTQWHRVTPIPPPICRHGPPSNFCCLTSRTETPAACHKRGAAGAVQSKTAEHVYHNYQMEPTFCSLSRAPKTAGARLAVAHAAPPAGSAAGPARCKACTHSPAFCQLERKIASEAPACLQGTWASASAGLRVKTGGRPRSKSVFRAHGRARVHARAMQAAGSPRRQHSTTAVASSQRRPQPFSVSGRKRALDHGRHRVLQRRARRQ